jgi:hypothetical protein
VGGHVDDHPVGVLDEKAPHPHGSSVSGCAMPGLGVDAVDVHGDLEAEQSGVEAAALIGVSETMLGTALLVKTCGLACQNEVARAVARRG